ncbi:hypothetical protein BC828DRAFT_373969 [Blastocladiella britannica]|nr:hypothetical protein BC828DRAFT_373969 [Blastocladiella britannica]
MGERPIRSGNSHVLYSAESPQRCGITLTSTHTTTTSKHSIDLSSLRGDVLGASVKLVLGSAWLQHNLQLKVEFSTDLLAPNAVAVPRSRVVAPNAPGFLDYLDIQALGDCAFLICDATDPIYASKLLLARASPFFFALLSKSNTGFVETSALHANEPIKFPDWALSAFLLVLVHIYSGWLPGSNLPARAEAYLNKHCCDPLEFDFVRWQPVYQLGRMLELDQFAVAINLVLAKKLANEHHELMAKIKSPAAAETVAAAAEEV